MIFYLFVSLGPIFNNFFKSKAVSDWRKRCRICPTLLIHTLALQSTEKSLKKPVWHFRCAEFRCAEFKWIANVFANIQIRLEQFYPTGTSKREELHKFWAENVNFFAIPLNNCNYLVLIFLGEYSGAQRHHNGTIWGQIYLRQLNVVSFFKHLLYVLYSRIATMIFSNYI